MTTPKEYWDNAAKDPDVRYKYIADDWAKTEFFVDLIETGTTNWGKVLEIGCGIGRLLEPLADNHETCQFYGIDISPEMLKLAPKKPNITYGKAPKNLDMVYSMLVFQHIPHEEKLTYIKMAYDLLKPGGTLVFQFVVGTDNQPYSYQTTIAQMAIAVGDVGFTPPHQIIEFLHEQWAVIKAVK